jgi:sugar phosphate isomerase/epimerase
MVNQMSDRRSFLKNSGLAAGALISTGLLSGFDTHLKKPQWGVQLFTLPAFLSNDFTGALKKISSAGYRQVEFFGPYEFSHPQTIERWKGIAAQLGIAKNAFYGYKPAEIKKIMDDLNLISPSVHLDILTMREGLETAADQLSKLNVKYVAIPALLDIAVRHADGYKQLADEFNSFGKVLNSFGMTFVYHNHGYEHALVDGEVPLKILLEHTDPRLVSFELDIFWMQAAGASPVQFLTDYPGRFKLMHIKDAAEKIRFSGDGTTPEQWMALFPKMADPGNGVFDLQTIIGAGLNSGTEIFLLERDISPNPDQTLVNSFNHLSSLKF